MGTSIVSDVDSLMEESNVQFECRVCFKKNPVQAGTSDIFQRWAPTFLVHPTTMATEMSKLANVEISDTKDHSKLICNKCFNRLCTALTFVIDVRQTAEILKKRTQSTEGPIENSTWPKPIQLDKNINGEVLGKPQDVEIKQELISDEELERSRNEGSLSESVPMLDIKVEPEEITPQSMPIQVTVNGTISEAQHDQVCSMTNGTEVYEYERLDGMSVKEEPTSEDEVQSDLPLECMLCANKMFRSVAGLKAHVIAQHNYKGVKRKTDRSTSPARKRSNNMTENKREIHICATCKRVFTTSTDLKVHEVCHDKFCCYACNSKFDSFNEVTQHRSECEVQLGPSAGTPLKTLSDAVRDRIVRNNFDKLKQSSREPRDVLQCMKCQVSFRDIFYLKLHNAIEHKNELDEHRSKIKEEKLESKTKTLEEDKKFQEQEEIKYNQIEIELESIFEYAIEKKEVVKIVKQKNVNEQDENNRLQETLEGKVENCKEEKLTKELKSETLEDTVETFNKKKITESKEKEHEVADKIEIIEGGNLKNDYNIKEAEDPKIQESEESIVESKQTENTEEVINMTDNLQSSCDESKKEITNDKNNTEQNKSSNEPNESYENIMKQIESRNENETENIKYNETNYENSDENETDNKNNIENVNENIIQNEANSENIEPVESSNENIEQNNPNDMNVENSESNNDNVFSNENIEPNDSYNESIQQNESSNKDIPVDESTIKQIGSNNPNEETEIPEQFEKSETNECGLSEQSEY